MILDKMDHVKKMGTTSGDPSVLKWMLDVSFVFHQSLKSHALATLHIDGAIFSCNSKQRRENQSATS